MNLSDIGVVFAICAPMVTGGGMAGKYYLENEFISGDDLQAYELRGLKRDARKLKRRVDAGQLEFEEDYLDLLDEIEELEEEL
jgi:hypothetical protein